MRKIERFIIWICSKFTRLEIERIIVGLIEVLEDRNPEVKPRDDFKEKHPHYRNFYVDPLPPLTDLPPSEPKPPVHYQELLQAYQQKHGRPLKPVKRHNPNLKVKPGTVCPHCQASHQYLYFNDGKKRSQLLCKICNNLFPVEKHRRITKTKYHCPHCHGALYRWKENFLVTIYKCPNDKCPAYLKAREKLNQAEKKLRKKRLSQFKLRYQYREYHFRPNQLKIASPLRPWGRLARIHNSADVVGLVLSFHVSFAVSARKSARIMREIFDIPMSYQTVLNYAKAAAYYCHSFNLKYKGDIDDSAAGDETYIKILGKHAYTFLFLALKSLKIIAYHVAPNRDVLPATATMTEALRTAREDQQVTFITDGNPAYPAGIHFLNANRNGKPVQHHKVIGLQNLDQESAIFRVCKQHIERLNRTYKFHTRAACGFKSTNGAIALTVLFVTYYNFLRPHHSLKYRPPIVLDELRQITTLQGRWCKILDISMALAS